MASIAKDIVDSIFSPTTKPQAGVVKVMNWSFYGLFLTLFGLAYATSWNLHVLALTGVAAALYASISWFILELGKVEEQKKQQEQLSKGDTASTQDTAVASASVQAQPDGAGSIRTRKAGAQTT